MNIRLRQKIEVFKNDNFIYITKNIKVLVSKVLSIMMVLVILVMCKELAVFLLVDLLDTAYVEFRRTLLKIFSLFFNCLIAFEILKNIKIYLKKDVGVYRVELAIVSSLVSVAYNIINLDLRLTEGIEIIRLGVLVFSLSISYLIIRLINSI